MNDLTSTSMNARQRSQADTRSRLLESAAHLFAEKGSKNTRTVDIAQRSQVAVGTVYLHFKSKDALLKEVLKVALTRLKQEIAKFPVDSGNLVRNKMDALATFTEHFPHLAAALFDGGNLATSPGQEVLEFLTASQERGLLEGVAKGYYRGDLNSALAARAMVGTLTQVLGWWAKNPEAVTKEEVIDFMTTMRLEGLRPQV